MSKLTDLRVLHDRFDVEAVNRNTRSATVSDLVEALQAEGGEVMSYWPGGPLDLKAGRYLVVPLGEDDVE